MANELEDLQVAATETSAKIDAIDAKVVSLQAAIDAKQDAIATAIAGLEAQIASGNPSLLAIQSVTESLKACSTKVDTIASNVDAEAADVDSTPTA